MSDSHIRILRQIARQSQREVDSHDAVDHAENAAAAGQRQHLGDAATRTRGQVTAAEERRKPTPHAER